MIEVFRSTVIDAPIEKVWAVIRDFNGHSTWHPAIAESTIENNLAADTIGAVRNFKLKSGEKLREKLLALSDADYSFSYEIIESEIPLLDYTAQVELLPVTEGNQTLWLWSSNFNTPLGMEDELADVVAKGVYEAGFAAVHELLLNNQQTAAASDLASNLTTQAQAIVVEGFGTPAVLKSNQINTPAPTNNQVQIRQAAVGVNFFDVYCRRGEIPGLAAGSVIGLEAAGPIEALGEQVTQFAVGDRVAYASLEIGAYTTLRNMPAELVVPLPDWLSYEEAAAVLLKGMTAAYLLHDVYPVSNNSKMLVCAAAGGVGNLLCQWGAQLGAHVIGVVSTETKASKAQAAGAHEVVIANPDDVAKQVLELTNQTGVDVVFDGVGKDSFNYSVNSLSDKGHLVSFGHASGSIGKPELDMLSTRSISITLAHYAHYAGSKEQIQHLSGLLFEMLQHKQLRVEIGAKYPLSEAAKAHQELEERRTVGSTILQIT